MKFTTIILEGSILSADILARIWADSQDLWSVYRRQMERIDRRSYSPSLGAWERTDHKSYALKI